ncbi:unnamed protein product [Ambrosiozyma monospora]|uniref:Unnamed protein product n=1 Tax=Ambrosiozyma monospora TaxID=43982 RepID=A0A9W7DE23_AMBMO|nr:unnamed protein product [Ambrosiozyma monospora]
MAFSHYQNHKYKYYTYPTTESTSKRHHHLKLHEFSEFPNYWYLLRRELLSKGCLKTVDCMDRNVYKQIPYHEDVIAQGIIFGSISTKILVHPKIKDHKGDGLAVLLKLRLLGEYREPRNEYELALEWRHQMHNFPNILEEQPDNYDYYISRYTFLLSQIRKVPDVGNYLTELEVTRHCLKSFMSSRNTKSVTKLLRMRGVSSHSFHTFNDMKEELVEAIQRTNKKNQMMLERQAQLSQMAWRSRFSAVKNNKNICLRKPVPAQAPAKIPLFAPVPAHAHAHVHAHAKIPVHVPAPAKIPVHVPAPAPAKVPVHVPAPAPAPAKIPVPVPEKVIVNKKQGPPTTKLPVTKNVETNQQTEQKSKSKSKAPKSKKPHKKQLDYFNDQVISRINTKLVKESSKQPSSPYDTGVYTASDKQPLKPDDPIFKNQIYKDEIKKPISNPAVPTRLLSLFVDHDSDEVRVGSSTGWTPETLYCYTPEYRARAMLGCL